MKSNWPRLTAIQYFFKDSKKQLMSKEDMKACGLPSPDDADALAMSFYCPVQKKNRGSGETKTEPIIAVALS